MSSSARIKVLMDERGITKAELARQLGVSRATVGDWFLNGYIPRGSTLAKLCSFFGVSAEDLLREDSGTSSIPEAPPAKSEMQLLLEELNKHQNKEELAKSLLAVLKATNKK